MFYAYDNIMVERWFRSLKTEEIYINEYRSPRKLRQAVGAYIEQYNTVRPHEALDNLTPEAVYYSCLQGGCMVLAPNSSWLGKQNGLLVHALFFRFGLDQGTIIICTMGLITYKAEESHDLNLQQRDLS